MTRHDTHVDHVGNVVGSRLLASAWSQWLEVLPQLTGYHGADHAVAPAEH